MRGQAAVDENAAPPGHVWKFFRAGGFDQVRLDRGDDLFALSSLDQKLWVALSCPVALTEFDAATLALLDADGDGHIRAPELLAAIDWLSPRLCDRDLLARGGEALPLAAIDDSTIEGRRALASAKWILAKLGRADAEAISVEDAADTAAIFAGSRFNGDGAITATSAADPGLAEIIADIGTCCGTLPDRSGEPGIDSATLARFLAEAAAALAWHRQAAPLPELTDPATAYARFAAVREKIDDFYARCRLAAYDARAADLLGAAEADFQALARASLATPGEAVAALPLAGIAAGRALPLAEGVNPAWSAAIADFAAGVVTPLLGPRESLLEADWQALCARLGSYAAWQAARPTSATAALPAPRLEAALAAADALRALLAQDLALADETAAIDEVARFARLLRDLARFANNFVAFRDFYTGAGKAIFQAGTLYLDGRSCELCVRVADPGKHAPLASAARIYLAYCECRRGDERQTIAAGFTDGDTDALAVGRNGVFYDRQGRDWEATIVKIVDHPISLRQAFWSPYKKMVRVLGEQLQKLAAARAESGEHLAAGAVDQAVKAAETSPPAKPASPVDVGKFAGIFAAIGLAIGAIGTAVAALVTGFLGLAWWQMPLALAGIALAISGPAVAVAAFKLRTRSLGPLLDAGGWAVNAGARINIPFGSALTQLARLPPGAERALTDPYAEAPVRWRLYLVLGALLAAGLGLLVLLLR